MTVHAFTGHIAGIGTRPGTRLVLGLWDQSPLGSFADVMIEDAAGHRTPDGWNVRSTDLEVAFTPGLHLWLSPLLRAVPPPLRRTASWARFCNPIASRLIPGVQTFGSAGSGRIEWYAARDVRGVDSATVRWHGADLGPLAPLTPPVRFGFASAPARPSLTALTSYVQDSS